MRELNINIDDMECYTLGEITDMMIEQGNDHEEWEYVPTQADFDRFAR